MNKLFKLLLVGIISILVLSGCSNSNDVNDVNDVEDMDATDTISDVHSSATSIGDFKAQDLAGNEVTKDIFSKYDLTLVNLFATFCSPCIEEMPYLDEIDKEMSNKSVNVIGIPLDVNENGKIDQNKLDKLNQIIKSTKAQYDIILPDDVLRSGRLKGVNSVPESFFVDKNGNIVGETYLGSHSKAEWEDIINKELAQLKK